MEKCKNWPLIKNQIFGCLKNILCPCTPRWVHRSFAPMLGKKKLENERGTWKNAKIDH